MSNLEWVLSLRCFESQGLNLPEVCLCGWMKREVQKRNVGTRDELLARISDAAARIKRREDQLRRTTRDLCTRFAKCTEADGGIFELLL